MVCFSSCTFFFIYEFRSTKSTLKEAFPCTIDVFLNIKYIQNLICPLPGNFFALIFTYNPRYDGLGVVETS